ncbi:MAG: hypothetical protein RL375_3977, partial [Pseudomonadota bacterium]
MITSPDSPADGSATTSAGQRTAHRICPLCEACCGLEIKLDRDGAT